VIVAQLLSRRSADDRQNRSPQHLGLTPVTATSASLRDQPGPTFDPIGFQQPKHLTPLEPEEPANLLRLLKSVGLNGGLF
jgi:hypothetical protein